MSDSSNEVWITGIGLVSSLGEGLDAHWRALTADNPKPVVDEKTFAPYAIHPICELDFSKQIPKRGDLRQMEDWQRIGTYAAGLALDDAGIKGNEELLAKTHIIAAAGNGERDPEADATVLEALKGDPKWRERLNDLLLTNLRPTLYLAQQTQLLAGNISIVHKVTGGSRTFKGEEIAGVQIVENAVQRIQSGQGELFLVGASYNAARWDQLLIWELNGRGNMVTGSMGAFLVVESRTHAEKRGARPYAGISGINTDRYQYEREKLTPPYHNDEMRMVRRYQVHNNLIDFDKNELARTLTGDDIDIQANLDLSTGKPLVLTLPILSGTSGGGFISELEMNTYAKGNRLNLGFDPVYRIAANRLGHGVEAQFPVCMALAALALSKNQFYPAVANEHTIRGEYSEANLADGLERVLVTGWGTQAGEGAALLERVKT